MIHSAIAITLAAMMAYVMCFQIYTWQKYMREFGIAFPLFGTIGQLCIIAYNIASILVTITPIWGILIGIGIACIMVDVWCSYIQSHLLWPPNKD